MARFIFSFLDNLPSGGFVGYKILDNYNTPPKGTGVNLEKVNTISSSQIYQIIVVNHSDEEQTITLGVSVGLDYNDLVLPAKGNLFREITDTVADTILFDVKNNINVEDAEQYFVTGSEPNNYIWYSGKLWRAVSIDPSDNSVKLVTQWNISAISYSERENGNFEGSYMEEWLNDTSVDGFLGNLREPEKFIKMNSVWNATETDSPTKPVKTTMVTDPVGLLNVYEYTMSYSGTDYSLGYLRNGLWWWTLTKLKDQSTMYEIRPTGLADPILYPLSSFGVRPTINLKPEIKIVAGDGTIDNPYRLEDDNDTNLSGTLLNTRYSGEYVRFGTGENNLYRIVSHEIPGLTKIVSVEPLKEDGKYINISYGINDTFSLNEVFTNFLNKNYINPDNNYITTEQLNMIAENISWYLGTVGAGTNYKLAKYTDTNMTTKVPAISARIGLLRYGELMAGQFSIMDEGKTYGTTTMVDDTYLRIISNE